MLTIVITALCHALQSMSAFKSLTDDIGSRGGTALSAGPPFGNIDNAGSIIAEDRDSGGDGSSGRVLRRYRT